MLCDPEVLPRCCDLGIYQAKLLRPRRLPRRCDLPAVLPRCRDIHPHQVHDTNQKHQVRVGVSVSDNVSGRVLVHVLVPMLVRTCLALCMLVGVGAQKVWDQHCGCREQLGLKLTAKKHRMLQTQRQTKETTTPVHALLKYVL